LSGAVLITVRAQAPQQAQIAFVSERDGNPEIYVMDSDGKNPRNLTNHPANDYIDDWFDPTVGRSVSPAGKQLTVWGEIKRK
jgi:Tol biopolymer transport system component